MHARRVATPASATSGLLHGRAGVHPAIVAGRIRHRLRNDRLLSQFVGAREVRPLLMGDAG